MNDLVKEFGVINEEYNELNEILTVATQAIKDATSRQKELKAQADLLVKLSGKSLVELEKEFEEEESKARQKEIEEAKAKAVEGEIVSTPSDEPKE